MTDLVELVASWIQALRIAGPGQWALRGLVLLAGAAAVLACWWWIPAPTVILALVLLLAAWAALWPGSWGPLAVSGVVVVWWLGAGGDAPWWRAIVLGLLLAVVHLGAALASASPSWAAVTARAASRMARAGGLYLAACLAASLAVWGISLIPGLLPWGGGWIAAGVAGLCAGVVAAILGLRGGTRV